MSTEKGVLIASIALMAALASACGIKQVAVEVSPIQVEPEGHASYFNAACPNQPPTVAQRPARICGDEGYAFLLNAYLKTQCGGCHFQGSFIHWNALGDPNAATAAAAARMYAKDFFIERTMDNPFLIPECEVRATDPVYRDLNEWFENPKNCP